MLYLIGGAARSGKTTLCLAVRQLGRRLPREVASGLWQWNRLARE